MKQSTFHSFIGKILDMKYEIKYTTFPDQLVGIIRGLGEERNFAHVCTDTLLGHCVTVQLLPLL